MGEIVPWYIVPDGFTFTKWPRLVWKLQQSGKKIKVVVIY